MTFRTCVRSIASWGVSKGIKGDHAAKMEAHSLPLCCRPSKSLKKSEAESRTWEIGPWEAQLQGCWRPHPHLDFLYLHQKRRDSLQLAKLFLVSSQIKQDGCV